jgi:hypothetical protein
MWYASCSVAPHLIPSTVPVPVVPGEAISAPDSIGTPSKPTCALVFAASDVVLDDEEDELDELLLPQPASSALTASVAMSETGPRRIRIGTVATDNVRQRCQTPACR